MISCLMYTRLLGRFYLESPSFSYSQPYKEGNLI